MNFVPFVVSLLAVSVTVLTLDVHAWTTVSSVSLRPTCGSGISSTRLYESTTPPQNAPRHDVGGDPFSSLPEDQKMRAMAYMEHQQKVPKPGFPADVRSLVQYNHGFAVMSTNSKS